MAEAGEAETGGGGRVGGHEALMMLAAPPGCWVAPAAGA